MSLTHPHLKKTAGLLALLACMMGALLTGCTRVEPWQRGTLSDHSMRPDRDRVASGLADHMWFSREAANGGRGVGGGGCGCN